MDQTDKSKNTTIVVALVTSAFYVLMGTGVFASYGLISIHSQTLISLIFWLAALNTTLAIFVALLVLGCYVGKQFDHVRQIIPTGPATMVASMLSILLLLGNGFTLMAILYTLAYGAMFFIRFSLVGNAETK